MFLLIELIFVVLIFREFPSFSLVSMTGILHLSYWGLVIVAGLVRERYARAVWQKFCCTYLPVVYHVVIHIVLAVYMVHEHHDHAHHHHEHELGWMIGGTLVAGILIALGECWLHRTRHCMTHHQQAHQHCHHTECEDQHQTH